MLLTLILLFIGEWLAYISLVILFDPNPTYLMDDDTYIMFVAGICLIAGGWLVYREYMKRNPVEYIKKPRRPYVEHNVTSGNNAYEYAGVEKTYRGQMGVPTQDFEMPNGTRVKTRGYNDAEFERTPKSNSILNPKAKTSGHMPSFTLSGHEQHNAPYLTIAGDTF
jgi:hypothetical protein